MRLLRLVLLLAGSVLVTIAPAVHAGCSPVLDEGSVQFDPDFQLSWTVCPPLVRFTIVNTTSNPTGWAAIGYGPPGQSPDNGHTATVAGPAGLDMTFCWADAAGAAFVTDFISNARTAPSVAICTNTGAAVCPDSSRGGANNVTTISVVRTVSGLTCTFERPLAASDGVDTAIQRGVEQQIFWAHGPTSASGAWPYKVQFHAQRGGAALTIHPGIVVFRDGFED